jgi:hypothetical protein
MNRRPGLLWIGALVLVGCTVSSSPDAGRDSGGGVDANLIPEDANIVQQDAGVDSGPMCEPGEILCGSTCTRVAGDPLNCGSCGVVCPDGVGCAAGRCNCELPRISCDGVCLDPESDPFNCGGCGVTCGPLEACMGGECILACTDPEVICVNRDESGEPYQVCADVRTDPINCGRCNTRCAGGSVCREGRCGCPDGFINCGGACVDPMNDANNCGSCRISCGEGGTCMGGRCTACGTGRTDCSGRCVDLQTDRLNCGSCARSCGTGEACSGGLCECATGLVDCGTGCTNRQTDPNNCGTCGTTCGPGGVCSMGACTCSSGLTLCGASCRNLQNDINNCGMCGNVCPALVGGVCNAGTCGCPAGRTDCSGTCVDTLTSRTNCGMCGMTCATGEFCIMGMCTNTPPVRYTVSTPTATEVPFIDACAATGRTVVVPMVDDASARVALPFNFRFWATDVFIGTLINVTSNGWVGLDGGTSATLSGSIPSTSTPNAVMAPHWGDLATRTGACVATIGTAPNRQFVIQWPDARNLGGGDTNVLNFEIILNEGSNIIDFAYQRMDGASARTTGLENYAGTEAIGGCGSTTCTPTAGTRYRFTPSP